MSITQEQVHNALKEAVDPNTGKDFFATKSARNIRVEGGNVALEIELGYPAKTQLEPIRKLISQKLRSIPGVETVNVEVNDGKLDIIFTSQVENPEINGIEIIPAS